MKSYSRHFDRRFSMYDTCISPTPRAVIVSFWAGDGYKKHADQLIDSIKAFGQNQLSYMVLTAERQDTWEMTCALKPSAIMHAMSILGHQHPVLWLDADARLRGIPVMTYGDADLAACRPEPATTWMLVNSSLLSGTLWFNTTLNAVTTLERWRDRCVVKPKQYDQEVLADLLRSPVSSHLQVEAIDPRDVCIPDLMPDVAPNARVIHLQASRTDTFHHG